MQPIAAQLRRGNKRQRSPEPQESINDLDAKIAELEKQLLGGADDESEDGSDSVISDDDGSNDGSEEQGSREHAKKQREDSPRVLSTLDEERIAPLPSHLLPSNRCNISNKSKKPKSEKPKQSSSGLEATVNELLKNYVPSEKKPFYCRVCQQQMTDLQSFEEHRASEFHRVATQRERQISQCKLCRIHFTSPTQLKEHLNGKAHNERLRRMKKRQEGNTQYT